MRAVALLAPHVDQHHVRNFEMPGVNLFAGNELDPTDQPDVALIFGGDGTIHYHLGGLVGKRIPMLIVPVGSANDFAHSLGIKSEPDALRAWQRFCSGGDNLRTIDLGTIEPLQPGLKPLKSESAHDAGLKPGSSTVGGVALTPGSSTPGGVALKPGSSTVGGVAPIPGSSSGAVRKEIEPGASHGVFGDEAEPGSSSFPDEAADPWQGETLESLHFVPDGKRRDEPKLGGRIMQSQLRRATAAMPQIGRTTFFCCIAGTGLDAAVNRLALQQPAWLRGHGGYVVGLLQVIGKFQPPQVKVSVAAGDSWQTRIDEPGFLIAVGNGPQYGHGMRLTHEARLDDGLFDVCFVRTLSKLRLLWLFHVVYRGGHLGMREVEYFRASRVRIHTEPATEVYADGEYICRTPVEVGVERAAFRVIVP